MKNIKKCLSSSDPACLYAALAALILFLHTALGDLGSYLYEQALIIPCLLLLATGCPRGTAPSSKRLLRLSLVMVAWFTFLMVKRTAENSTAYSLSLFFCTYLFAFPLATLTRDGGKKRYLKIFGTALLAASLFLAAISALLLLDILPGFLSEYAYWDGVRLCPFHHSNIAATILLCGIAFCLIFVCEAKKRAIKISGAAVILLLLCTMALTNCRTAILLTGALLGGTAFFSFVKGRWQRFLPGLILVAAAIVLTFSACRQLYQLHSEAMLAKYTALYQAHQEDTSDSSEESPEAESIPIRVNEKSGEISLQSESSQKSLAKDLTSLNSRTKIWNSTLFAFRESRAIQIFGIDSPGKYISYYTSSLEPPFEVAHAHNSWLECLMGLGLPGFVLAVIYTLITLWNCALVLLRHSGDIWKRVTALLAICLLVTAVMEPYLFFTQPHYHIFDFVFFLCSGYLAHWQEEDNRKIYQYIYARLHK